MDRLEFDRESDHSALRTGIGCSGASHPAHPGLLLFKMVLVGIWNGDLSDESVEDMANSNLHVMRFL
jgi:IS5 family transposase